MITVFSWIYRWALIAGRIPGRTANNIKNYYNSHLHKKLRPQHGKEPKLQSKRRKKEMKKWSGGYSNVVVIKPQERRSLVSNFQIPAETPAPIPSDEKGIFADEDGPLQQQEQKCPWWTTILPFDVCGTGRMGQV